MVRLLLAHDRRTANNKTLLRGTTPLHIAAVRGDLGMVRELITAGADITATDSVFNTPLYYAGKAHHSEVVDVLYRCSLHKASSARSRELSVHGRVKPPPVAAAAGYRGATERGGVSGRLRLPSATQKRVTHARPLTAAIVLSKDSARWRAPAGVRRREPGDALAAAAAPRATTSFAAAREAGAQSEADARLRLHLTARPW